MKQMYEKTVLDNGLRIVTHPMPKMQSVALGIWIKAGGRYESVEYKGISHYLEHLAFKGSKNYSCRKIKESIEGVGGSLNGFTSEELTCYLTKLPHSYLDLALDILSDMVINPSLLQQDIEKERTVILEEIKMHKDQPQGYVYDLLDNLLWPNQPLGMSIIGTVESINRTQKQDLNSYKQQYYTPSNIVISATGLLEHNKFINRVKKRFYSLQNNHTPTFSKAKEKQHRPQLEWLDKDTEQTHMALGFHSFRRGHPLKYALGLLNIILGANMSSRLFNELREKRGLAYDIGTQVKRFKDTGAFIVHAGIDNHNVSDAIKLILLELRKAKDELVSIDELKRAKEFYSGQLTLALEDTLDHMLWIGESMSTLNKTYCLDEIIKEIESVKRQDILKASKQIFKKKNLNLALIGPLKDNRKVIYNQLHID